MQTSIASWLGSGSINLFGLPFAGKDTQARMLMNALGALEIGGGEILRSYHDQAELQNILASGKLIPTGMYIKMIVPYFSQAQYAGKPLILSSVGRSNGEQEAVFSAAAQSGHPIKAVILLSLDEAEIWKRFEISQMEGDRGGRADDQKSVIVTRLDEFRRNTMPVIEFYREKGLLIEIDGSKPREEVEMAILTALSSRALTEQT